MTLAALFDRSLAPLDESRRLALAAAVRFPPLAWLVAKRERRLAAIATSAALLALALATSVPVLLVMLGPLLFGVPHVAADVRYLVLRRKLEPAFQRAVLAGCAVLIGIAALDASALVHFDALRIELSLASLGIASAMLAARPSSASRARLAAGLLLVAGLGGAALVAPRAARLVLLHGHNLVGLALWLWLFRRDRTAMALPLAVMFLGAATLVSGALWRIPLDLAPRLLSVHVLEVSDWLAPGLRADRALGLTACYAFLQSMHYLVWLVLIPQDDVAAQGTATFRMSARSLLRDLGRFGLAAIALGTLLVAVGALFEARATRELYLSLAMFHVYLELALAGWFWVRGGHLGGPRAAA